MLSGVDLLLATRLNGKDRASRVSTGRSTQSKHLSGHFVRKTAGIRSFDDAPHRLPINTFALSPTGNQEAVLLRMMLEGVALTP
jgi:hypothetical protein